MTNTPVFLLLKKFAISELKHIFILTCRLLKKLESAKILSSQKETLKNLLFEKFETILDNFKFLKFDKISQNFTSGANTEQNIKSNQDPQPAFNKKHRGFFNKDPHATKQHKVIRKKKSYTPLHKKKVRGKSGLQHEKRKNTAAQNKRDRMEQKKKNRRIRHIKYIQKCVFLLDTNEIGVPHKKYSDKFGNPTYFPLRTRKTRKRIIFAAIANDGKFIPKEFCQQRESFNKHLPACKFAVKNLGEIGIKLIDSTEKKNHPALKDYKYKFKLVGNSTYRLLAKKYTDGRYITFTAFADHNLKIISEYQPKEISATPKPNS